MMDSSKTWLLGHKNHQGWPRFNEACNIFVVKLKSGSTEWRKLRIEQTLSFVVYSGKNKFGLIC